MRYWDEMLDAGHATHVEYKTEYVRGERFINARGEEICIGMTERVQRAIGLPFEAFKNQNKRLNDIQKNNNQLRQQNESLKLELNMFRNMNFREKIKFLFKRGEQIL